MSSLPVLPDSRPIHRTGQEWRVGFWSGSGPGRFWIPAQWWERTFCASCGVFDGWVTSKTMDFAWVLCNDCVGKHGAIKGCYVSPTEIFAEAVVAEQMEKYGRLLTDAELLTVAEGTSPLATLINRGIPAITGG